MSLRDIKGPLSLSHDFTILLLLSILVLLALLAFLFIFFSRKKLASVVVPEKLPHEIAYEQLEVLRQKDLIRQGRTKEYYSEISDIIRHYLENRFLLKAPEMTTEEFLGYVRDYGQLMDEHKSLLKEFLSACDLVKFAKHAPSVGETSAIFVSAKNFVDETVKETALR